MYGTLSKFFTDSGDVDSAFTCFRAIYQAGLKPTPTIYNALMALLADRGDAEAAVQIFNMMTDEGWANVGETRCLVTLMDAYGSGQNIAKVVDIFQLYKISQNQQTIPCGLDCANEILFYGKRRLTCSQNIS